MSSTRNRNTPGNYKADNNINNNRVEYFTNDNYGKQIISYYPGDGLLQGRVASENLSYNNIDIETQLFGIGSTNLVTPKIDSYPQIRNLQSLSIINKPSIIIPEPLIVHKEQRPYPLP